MQSRQLLPLLPIYSIKVGSANKENNKIVGDWILVNQGPVVDACISKYVYNYHASQIRNFDVRS